MEGEMVGWVDNNMVGEELSWMGGGKEEGY